MKNKIVILGIMLLMMATMVMAEPVQLENKSRMQIHNEIQDMATFRNSELDGFERVQLQVQTETQAQNLDQKMSMLQERNKLMIQNMTQVEVAEAENGQAIVEGKTKAKLFGFINTNREMVLVIDDMGNVTRLRRAFDFMFRYDGQAGQVSVSEM